MKTQVVVDKKSKKIICTSFCNGKKHDFRLYKESNLHVKEEINIMTDTGYLGLNKIHPNTSMPKKKTKKNPLTPDQKKSNKEISSQRVTNEHIIGLVKRFKIVSDRYRNRRKRFGLRFNLIAGVCNADL